MNPAIQGALIGAGFGFLGVVANQVYNYLSRRQEQQESYRLKLYDKRLEVHQQAYKWVMTLHEQLASERDPREELFRSHDGAREWYEGNCLYLDETSRVSVVNFIDIAKAYAKDTPTDDSKQQLELLYIQALRDVQHGIGMKHLERGIAADLEPLARALDALTNKDAGPRD